MTKPIQRWGLGENGQIFSVYGADGDWVRYDDHLAVIAAAVQQAEALVRDATLLNAIIAINGIPDRWNHDEDERLIKRSSDGKFLDRDDVLTAIFKLREVK
jgi:hypothetical protein